MCKFYYCNMKRCALLLSLLFLSLAPKAQNLSRPKLVVGIVVDQMRWDYLYRYYDHYGKGGFRRLMKDGFRCEQAMINYLPSYTAPGHASVYTGSVPALHGIAGNDWYEDGKLVYCTDDKSVSPVGGSLRWGQMSPRNLIATTVTDELRLATNLRSRVYGISLKDRSSILPAGHMGQAYWFDDSTGTFSSSSFYGQKLPSWVQRFNERRYADSLLAQEWALMDRPGAYTNSSPDDNRYEGAPTGFPHRSTKGKGVTTYNRLRFLPGGNWLTLQLAKDCIRSNSLGRGSDPDMLCISFSSTDYAGHQYGPNALEMEDMFIRLDRELGQFLEYLDKEVGEGAYTVFLTADHGAAHNSLYLEDQKVPGGNVYEGDLGRDLGLYINNGVNGAEGVVINNYQVHFQAPAAGTHQSQKKLAMEWLRKRPEIAYVIDLEEPANNTLVPAHILSMVTNGYYAPRTGSLQIILKPAYYAGYAPTGTTHGTWNPYDTHIPLLWYGWGIPKGQTHREVYMTDIAATLAALLHIQMPNACVGKVIKEIVH